MKIRSLLLGSVVAVGGLSTGAFAADLGVLTSLDVCDALGLSGLTISSDTNCLQITGEVKYKFTWGDYSVDQVWIPTADDSGNHGTYGGDGANDWESRFDAWIKFVATADSDFGPAKAVLKLKQVDDKIVTGVEFSDTDDFTTDYGGSTTEGVVLDEAYVSIGDSTVIMAGKKGSIMKKGDDEPLNWLGLFNSEDVDVGVNWGVELPDGGHVIQVVSDLGNGFSIGAGLENLDGSSIADGYDSIDGHFNADDLPGTAVGVISYAGEGISAHLTVAAGGVLDGEINNWGAHAGFAGTFDNFKVVLAGAFGSHDDDYDSSYDYTSWNVLASASATFDIFTIAGSVEAAAYDDEDADIGAGLSFSAAVADGVTLNLGGRWYHNGVYDVDGYQVAASVAAAVTETLTLTGEIGYLNSDVPAGGITVDDVLFESSSAFYGAAKLDWAPGGGYTSSIKGTITSPEEGDMGYKIETEFKKTFE